MSPRRSSWQIVVVLVAAMVTPARADERDEARALRRGGQIVTGIGGGLDLAGAGLLLGAFFTRSCAFALGAPEEGPCAFGGGTANDSAVRGMFWSGIALSVVGDAALIIGGVQWGVGARRLKRLQRATAAR